MSEDPRDAHGSPFHLRSILHPETEDSGYYPPPAGTFEAQNPPAHYSPIASARYPTYHPDPTYSPTKSHFVHPTDYYPEDRQRPSTSYHRGYSPTYDYDSRSAYALDRRDPGYPPYHPAEAARDPYRAYADPRASSGAADSRYRSTVETHTYTRHEQPPADPYGAYRSSYPERSRNGPPVGYFSPEQPPPAYRDEYSAGHDRRRDHHRRGRDHECYDQVHHPSHYDPPPHSSYAREPLDPHQPPEPAQSRTAMSISSLLLDDGPAPGATLTQPSESHPAEPSYHTSYSPSTAYRHPEPHSRAPAEHSDAYAESTHGYAPYSRAEFPKSDDRYRPVSYDYPYSYAGEDRGHPDRYADYYPEAEHRTMPPPDHHLTYGRPPSTGPYPESPVPAHQEVAAGPDASPASTTRSIDRRRSARDAAAGASPLAKEPTVRRSRNTAGTKRQGRGRTNSKSQPAGPGNGKSRNGTTSSSGRQSAPTQVTEGDGHHGASSHTYSDPSDEDGFFGTESVRYMVSWHRHTKRAMQRYEDSYHDRYLRKVEQQIHRLHDTAPVVPRAYADNRDAQEAAEALLDVGQDQGVNGYSAMPLPEDPGAVQAQLGHMVWSSICDKQISRVHRHAMLNHSVRLHSCRRIAHACQREVRRAVTRSHRDRKDMQIRSKRAMREMLMFWKRNEREEREARKRAEKEAQERLRIEEERREVERQSRKLNFLITQTELYSHFVGSKIQPESGPAASDKPAEATFDDLDFDADSEEALKARAMQSAQNALALQKQNTEAFDSRRRELQTDEAGVPVSQDMLDEMNFMNPSSMPSQPEVKQPKMLMCELKEYQLKGLNWLANLYEQGINGILADEMGLGKTVQSISLLAYLAEVHQIQGPFLVVAPASTLHNWQQEISRFIPAFVSLPYWGNVRDRKVLRKFWNKNTIYSSNPPFNVLITSYQMAVADERYFQRIKWQYMILDEAQAIKSSSSARWRTLLNFYCRNRLLLTGTPIQNSMQELWALLHFIMPTLFDSHAEFSDWFSRDIESHAENKTSLNQHQLNRLQMILKPFMLRRIKRHVQHELGEKIEIEVPCELTPRQRHLYQALKGMISVSELLAKASSTSQTDSDSLMNLVMQFRKVCNHPELFERAEVQAPYAFCSFSITPSLVRAGDCPYLPYGTRGLITYEIPKFLYRHGGLLRETASDCLNGEYQHLLQHQWTIWSPAYIHASLAQSHSAFGFAPFIDYSPQELAQAFQGSMAARWNHCITHNRQLKRWWQYALTTPEVLTTGKRGTRTLCLLLSTTTTLRHRSLSRRVSALQNVVLDQWPFDFLTRASPAYQPHAVAPVPQLLCADRRFTTEHQARLFDPAIRQWLVTGSARPWQSHLRVSLSDSGSRHGLSRIWMPAANKLIAYSGKMVVLDRLLIKLKAEGHRVLVYFQMTKMLDLMEEYLTYRQYTYLRLDGSSKISDRRDMVTDWQTNEDIFIFLLSTRAGGLGINLTAADTVVFYESDWNPTVDQQAMDRAHRLGQTRQVTVYRLVTRGTIEERILVRAKQKDEIHKVVIAGGDFKPPTELKSNEIVSLLLEEEENEDRRYDAKPTDTAEAMAATNGGDAHSNSTTNAGYAPDVSVNPDAGAIGQSTALMEPPPTPARKPLITSRMLEKIPSSITTMNALFDQFTPVAPEPSATGVKPSGRGKRRATRGRSSQTPKRARRSKDAATTPTGMPPSTTHSPAPDSSL
ncbi:putative DNA helicase ino80 [Dimargaris xerosporica]|nr:putative DNA helicase ino80 [Dimargaris xerosporica]